VFDLTVAIEIGMVLSAFLFMNRMANVTNVGIVKREFEEGAEEETGENAISSKKIPKDVLIYEVNGPFFFGAASKFKEAARVVEEKSKIFILRLRNVPAIDSTGLSTIEDFYDDCKKQGMVLILSGIHAQPLIAAERSGLMKKIGIENCVGSIDDALERAKEIMASQDTDGKKQKGIRY
jgi:SulP family sulfate permease